MARHLLPIGIQSFRKLRESNCYYVDKTGYALRLAEEGTHYFLSRPRRFGKSLFLDTLKELFAGSRELFHGLRAYDHWDWSQRYPVVKLSFGKGTSRSRDTCIRTFQRVSESSSERPEWSRSTTLGQSD